MEKQMNGDHMKNQNTSAIKRPNDARGFDLGHEVFPTVDYQQIYLNGGPPCFAIDPDLPTRFCCRAEAWEGHGHDHDFVSLEELVRGSALNAGLAGQWVAITGELGERLPKPLAESVLITWQGDGNSLFVEEAVLDEDGRWRSIETDGYGEPIFRTPVIAWMPLPSPYEPAGGE